MNISVVVPIFNNGYLIEGCLRAIAASTYPVSQVIVVDDGSSDDGAEVAGRFPCEVIRLNENRGVGPARNAGAARATGDLIFFTDGDVWIRPDTIAEGVRFLSSNPGIACAVGLYAKECGVNNFWSELKNAIYHHVHMNSSDDFGHFIGNCGLISARLFQELGGFAESGPYARCLEDVDLGFRLIERGGRIGIVKSMQVVHYRRFTFRSLLHSDLFKRALPWTELILRYGGTRLDNCTQTKDAICAALAGAAIVLALSAFWFGTLALSVAALACCSIIVIDMPLIRALTAEKGLRFGVCAAPTRCIFYAVSSIGIILGFGRYSLSRQRRRNHVATTS